MSNSSGSYFFSCPTITPLLSKAASIIRADRKRWVIPSAVVGEQVAVAVRDDEQQNWALLLGALPLASSKVGT
jgi:hypothetical protein